MSPSPTSRPGTTARRWAVTAVFVLLGALAGCTAAAPGDGSGQPADDEGATPSELQVVDAWVKATDDTMTAAFMVLDNPTDDDIEIVAATSDVAGLVELHEMADVDGTMVMREVDGPLVVPAQGSLELAPGGLHIMLMDLRSPLLPGEVVTIELALGDGSTIVLEAVVKDFAGGNETYEPDHDDESGDSHGDEAHGDDGHDEGTGD